MNLKEIVWRSRNDFTGIVECEFCGCQQSLENGYDDTRFRTQVIPAIKCLDCNRRSNEIIPEGIGDPGYQGAVKVKQEQYTDYRWVKA